MPAEKSIIYYGPGRPVSASVFGFARERGLTVLQAQSADEVSAMLNRSFPACLVLDLSDASGSVLELCRTMKSDAFTAIVPVVVQVAGEGKEASAEALEAGAAEVMSDLVSDREKRLRLDLLLRRAERDVSVHPTTRLPGTVQIERDLIERMSRDEIFAVCYADLDHFKEFNDRY